MKSAMKMEIIFQDKILDLNIVHTIIGIVTDMSDESLTVMLENNKFIIITLKSLLEINEPKEYDF